MIDFLDLNSGVYVSNSLSLYIYINMYIVHYQVYVSISINPPHEQMCSPAEPNGCNPGGVTTTQSNNTLNQLDWVCFNWNQKTKQNSWTSKWRLSLNLFSFELIYWLQFKQNQKWYGQTSHQNRKLGRGCDRSQTFSLEQTYPTCSMMPYLPPWLLHFLW